MLLVFLHFYSVHLHPIFNYFCFNYSSVCVCVCTSIICPVEMSMLECAGSSLQDEVLVRAEGLGMGPSLSWDDTLFIREEWRGSTLSTGGFTDILCLHSSYTQRRIKSKKRSEWVKKNNVGVTVNVKDHRLTDSLCFTSILNFTDVL